MRIMRIILMMIWHSTIPHFLYGQFWDTTLYARSAARLSSLVMGMHRLRNRSEIKHWFRLMERSSHIPRVEFKARKLSNFLIYYNCEKWKIKIGILISNKRLKYYDAEVIAGNIMLLSDRRINSLALLKIVVSWRNVSERR